MKLKELKEKFQHKFLMRMTAGILCVAVAAGGFGISGMHTGEVSAVEKNELEEQLVSMMDTHTQQGKSEKEAKEAKDAKEETVYLIADANGTVRQTIVSNWLKNGSKNAQIKDVSELSDIKNVKGDETFTQNGTKLIWQANGQDLYYQGTTQKKLPISQQVTYYLDGKKIMPEELAGKSGSVTIRFDYTNKAKTTVKINGKKTDIYVPFTAVSGVVLDDSFRNVRVNSGRVLSDGSRMIAVGIAMPGLKKSLGVQEKDFDKDFEFPEYVEITAEVENFSLEMTATAVMAGLLSDSSFSERLDFQKLDDTVDEMSGAMGELKDGGRGLSDGLDTLKGSMSGFSDGVSSLASGVEAYTNGVSQLAEGIRTVNSGSGALESGVQTLNASAKTIHDGVQALDQSLHTKMTEQEQAAVKKEVGETIQKQFQKGTDTYNRIYEAAVQNFTHTMQNETTVQTVQAGIQAGMQAQGLTSDEVVAALAQYYAQHGFTDAQGETYSAETCQSNVPGTETTYAAFFASAVLNGGLSSALAGGITNGIAEKGAASAAEAVAGACETAAKQAGEAAAISGAEAAKQKIAAAIEAKDEKSGYSLVSGTKALSEGTQKLAQSVPALKEGMGQLVSGADALTGNSAALKEGAAKLTNGAGQLNDGIGKLDGGAHALNDGLKEFDKKAVKKIADAYHGDVKDLSERIKAVISAGEDYRTFAGAADDMEATTKFIIRTDGIQVEEE